MNCSLSSFSVHGILQTRILEWIAMPSSRESSWPRDWIHLSCGSHIVQFFSRVQLFVTHAPQQARLPCPSPTPGVHSNSCPLSQWCHPATSSSVLPFSSHRIFPSITVFSNESVLCIRWSKYWSVSFSISPSNEYSGLISLRMNWLDLLKVQRTVKSLLQHHTSKASIHWHSAFFILQLSHPYMTTGKTIALTRWTFVGKVMSSPWSPVIYFLFLWTCLV